jgi:hypothetical protein
MRRKLRWSFEELHKHAPSVKHPPEIDPVTLEAIKLDLDVQSTFLNILLSTTTGHFPHNDLGLRRAETATSASQPE